MSERTGSGVGLRLVATVALVAAAFGAQQVPLPGLVPLDGRAPVDRALLSVVSLGLMPLFTGFVLVELAALAIPPWRRLRTDGPEGRRVLRRAGLIATVLVAAVQGWFFATWAESVPLGAGGASLLASPGLAGRALVTLSLVGGVLFLAALAWLVGGVGIGNGFSLLLLGGALVEAVRGLPFVAGAVAYDGAAPLGVVLLALVGGALVLARSHRRAPDPEVALPAPPSGLVPLTVASGLLAAIGLLLGAGSSAGQAVRVAHLMRYLEPVAVGLLGFALARLFVRRRRLVDVFSRAGAGDDLPARLLAAARRATLLGVVVLVGWTVLRGWAGPALHVNVVSTVVATAVLVDVAAEWAAWRRHGALVAVWPLGEVALTGAALGALERAGIPAAARGVAHRALLQFFGPYIPVEILVPRDRAAEAAALLARVLPRTPA